MLERERVRERERERERERGGEDGRVAMHDIVQDILSTY